MDAPSHSVSSLLRVLSYSGQIKKKKKNSLLLESWIFSKVSWGVFFFLFSFSGEVEVDTRVEGFGTIAMQTNLQIQSNFFNSNIIE